MTKEQTTERMIQGMGINAPRLTPTLINNIIVKEDYHIFPGTTVTICMLTLRNGFSTIGESAAVSLENFSEKIGRKIAKEKAKEKIWMVEGYLLKQKLFEEGQ